MMTTAIIHPYPYLRQKITGIHGLNVDVHDCVFQVPLLRVVTSQDVRESGKQKQTMTHVLLSIGRWQATKTSSETCW